MSGPFESLGISYQNDERSARETTSLLGMGLVVGLDFCASAECLQNQLRYLILMSAFPLKADIRLPHYRMLLAMTEIL